MQYHVAGPGAFSEAAWCLLELRRASEDPGASALQGALEERGSHFAQVAEPLPVAKHHMRWKGAQRQPCVQPNMLLIAGRCRSYGALQTWLSACPVVGPHLCCVLCTVSRRCMVSAWWAALL